MGATMRMRITDLKRQLVSAFALCAVGAMLGGCSISNPFWSSRPEAPRDSDYAKDWVYRVGPGDSLNIFVWRNPELSQTVAVRPDGRFSTPLVKEYLATGKTPPELATELEKELGEYVRDPLVTVTVNGFVGEYYDQVRVVGEAGLTDFAAGNRAVLVRYAGGKEEEYSMRLDDLIRDGDISANVALQPGDIIIIPEAWF
jgi:polysaccharide biosynthesis/export protein